MKICPQRKFRVGFALVLTFGVSATARAQQTQPNGLPPWAYNIPDKVQPPVAPPPTGPVHVPGSTKEYDAATASGNANPPDWFPEEHGPAPKIVTGEGAVTQA